MARTNYSFEKRQRELAKKKKKEEKLQQKNLRKGSKGPAPDDETADSSLEAPAPADAGDGAATT